MSISLQPDNDTTRDLTDSGPSANTDVPQRGRSKRGAKVAETQGGEAMKNRESIHDLAAKKLAAIQTLAELLLEEETPGTKRARKATTRYLSEALDVLEVLGPEFESVITLKVMRGIENKTLKETVATMMWDKEWKLQEVAEILKASVNLGTMNLAFLILKED